MAKNTDDTDLLFVYGTLMPEKESPLKNYIRESCEIAGIGWVYGKLLDLGGYPGLLETSDFPQMVEGIILRLLNPFENLNVFDAYEGIGPEYPPPQEYIRVKRKVHTSGEMQECWVYLYNLSESISK